MPIKPVFVIGVARSGTTLTARAIASHSNAEALIDSMGSIQKSVYIEIARSIDIDLTYDSPFCDAYFSNEKLRLAKKIKKADLHEVDISSHRFFFCPKTSLDSKSYSPIPLENDFFEQTRTLPDAIYKVLKAAEARNHNITAFKDNYCIELVWPIKKAFPNAAFIFPYRDPRAVVASRIAGGKKFGVSSDIHLISRMRAWRSHIAWAFAAKEDFPDDVLMIPYENLVAHPLEWLKRICALLQIEYESSMTGASGFGKDKNLPAWSNNSSFENQLGGIYAGSVERWKSLLSEGVTQGIEYLAFHEMSLLGYDRFFLPPPPYSTENACSFLQNDQIPDKDAWRCDTKPFEYEVECEQNRHKIIQKKSASRHEIEYHLLTPAIARLLEVAETKE